MEQSSTRNIGNGESTGSANHSFGELMKQLSDQSTRLARMEVELAKAELTQKGKQIGAGAGAFGGAAVVGLYVVGAVTAAAILGLSEAVDGWLAALIVAGAYTVIAAILALVGRNRVEAGTPPVPQRAIESSKEDIETAKRSAKEARV